MSDFLNELQQAGEDGRKKLQDDLRLASKKKKEERELHPDSELLKSIAQKLHTVDEKLKGLKLDPKIEVNVPEVKVPEITIPEIKVPEIKIPEIKIPEIKLPVINVPEVKIPTINVPKPEVIVNVPKITIPKIDVPEVRVDYSKVVNILLEEITPTSPLPVQLFGPTGKPIDVFGPTVIGGGGGGGAPKAIRDIQTSSGVSAFTPDGRFRVDASLLSTLAVQQVHEVGMFYQSGSAPVPTVGAGAEWVATVPAGKKWHVISTDFLFTTAAGSTPRFVRIFADNGSGGPIAFRRPASHPQIASSLWGYSYTEAVGGGSTDYISQMSMPITELVLGAGWRIYTLTSNIQAGDQFSSVAIQVHEEDA